MIHAWRHGQLTNKRYRAKLFDAIVIYAKRHGKMDNDDISDQTETDNKTLTLALTFQGLRRHLERVQSVSKVAPHEVCQLCINSENLTKASQWYTGKDKTDSDTFFVDIDAPSPGDGSVLVYLQATQPFRVSLLRIGLLESSAIPKITADSLPSSYRNGYNYRLADPHWEKDPFHVVQSVIDPHGAERVQIIQDSTTRVYANFQQATPLVYQPRQIMAAVRIEPLAIDEMLWKTLS